MNITLEYLASQGLSENFPERFWEKVFFLTYDRGCWLWTGCLGNGRYGTINRFGGAYPIRAHRASWILHRGPIPADLEVCHLCDIPSCVRPDHLWIGTHPENMADCKAKGRARSVHGERHKLAKLTDSDVMAIKTLQGRVSGAEIGRRFGVSKSTACRILSGRLWTHIQ